MSIKDLYCSLPYILRTISNSRQKRILDRNSNGNFFFEFTYLKLKSVLHLTTRIIIFTTHIIDISLFFPVYALDYLYLLNFYYVQKRPYNVPPIVFVYKTVWLSLDEWKRQFLIQKVFAMHDYTSFWNFSRVS